jgi:acetyl-CoA carboxylase biotin carboxyl carrier protein
MLPIFAIMGTVSDQRKAIDELADLMEEFSLEEARLTSDGVTIAFGRRRAQIMGVPVTAHAEEHHEEEAYDAPAAPPVPTGQPVPSPMGGIFYSSQSPGTPPFAAVGSTVAPGQIIGLIEAMKVFNEVTSPFGGIVDRVMVENGAVVSMGDVLMYLK